MNQNTIYICISWYSKNLLISCEKMLMSAELKGCDTLFIYFLDLLWVRYNCAKFHHCRICVTYFREGGAFLPRPPHPWAALKQPILNRIKCAELFSAAASKLPNFVCCLAIFFSFLENSDRFQIHQKIILTLKNLWRVISSLTLAMISYILPAAWQVNLSWNFIIGSFKF